ncbi:Protease Do-like 9 [Chlorella vulgaris]
MEPAGPEPLSSKCSSPRRAKQVMASAFGSPKSRALEPSAAPPPPPFGGQLPPPVLPCRVQASKLDLSHGRGAGSSASISTTTTTTVSASGTVANAGKTSEDPAGGVAPPPSIPPLNFNSQLSMTDLVEEQLILDPNTPRSPKHQMAEHIMTSGSTAQVMKRHMDAVVKVFATHSKPNFTLPWQRQQQFTSKSTGFAVRTDDGKRWLLTNAHSTTYHTQVQLKRRGDDEKYPARVLAIGTECDVALLEVEDEAFWKDIMPLELGDLPALQEAVAVVGYPIGGDSLAISAGVVSRVQMTHYSHGSMSLLAVQTDAAINSGNSGGPVMNAKGQCVGIAFQSLSGNSTQSVGYVIPTSVVRHFLADVQRHEHYTGFPALNIVWQEMDSKALKKAYKMQPHQKGVLVRSVGGASHEAAVLRKDDVLLRIEGQDVGTDGTVPFRHGERVDFKYLVTNKHVGDTVTLGVLRQGQELELEVTLSHYHYLVPPHLREAKPSYFIVGGLVFTVCTDPYLLQRYGSLGGAPVRLMGKSYYGVKNESDEQVVVLSSVLACDATLGYESTLGIKDSPVVAFNGEPVRNLAQLARLVNDCTEDYMRWDLEAGGKVVVMESATARRCTAVIKEDHNVADEMSRDVRQQLEEWQAAAERAAEAAAAAGCTTGGEEGSDGEGGSSPSTPVREGSRGDVL